MVKPKDQKREPADTTALSRTPREAYLSEEPSSPSHSSTIEPSKIPVEELVDYYNSTKPPGRKYSKQIMSGFEDLYIDDSREDPEIPADEDSDIKSKGKVGGMKQAAKITGTKGTKSQTRKQSRSKAETKAGLTSQPTLAKDKKAKGKSKRTEEDDDEEEEKKKDNSEQQKRTPPPEARYDSCDQCAHKHIGCLGADRSLKSDDWLCNNCRKEGYECHFSLRGFRHLNAKK